MEITTVSPLLPRLVRHCGWILSCDAVRGDGRTGYSRLKGREHTSGTAICGRVIWYQLPKTADLTELDDRRRTATWLGKSDRRDEHIIRLETGPVLARSVRREVEGKRWNESAEDGHWNARKPRPGEVVRRRYITRALVKIRRLRGMLPKDINTQCDARHDLSSSAQERMAQSRPEPRRSSPLHQIQQHRTLSQRQRQHKQVESTRMRWRQRTLSQQRAAVRLLQPHQSDHLVSRDDETMEQEGPESERQRTVACLQLCSLLTPGNEIPMSHVAAHEIDCRPVYDHKMSPQAVSRFHIRYNFEEKTGRRSRYYP